MRHFIIICLIAPVTAFGQGVSVSSGPNGLTIDGFPEPDVQKTLDHWEKHERLRSLRPLLLHVRAIGEECGLDDQGKRKMELIAKRIFNRRTQQARTQLRSFMRRTGLTIADEEEQPEAEPEKKLDPNAPDTLLISGCGIKSPDVITFDSAYRVAVTWHPLWLKQIKEELSRDQQAKYERWQDDRYTRQCSAAATRWAMNLDEKVALTTSQREKVIERLKAACPKRKPMTGPVASTSIDYSLAIKFRELKEMSDLLTEEQVSVWNELGKVVKSNRVGFRPQP